MAIMQRCCCFDNVRSGSTASGIYTLIYSALALAYAAYQLALLAGYLSLVGPTGFYVGYCLGVLLYVLMLIASILVLVGVSKDERYFLMPYMIVMPIVILLHLAYCVFIIVIAASVGSSYSYNSAGRSAGVAVLVVELLIVVLLTILDVFCFLCVVSQYQELKDGRGRLADVTAHRTLVISSTTPGFSGTVVVTQGGVQQQGYPPQQQGYPPQQQGYAPQQDYPPPGYPAGAQDQFPQKI